MAHREQRAGHKRPYASGEQGAQPVAPPVQLRALGVPASHPGTHAVVGPPLSGSLSDCLLDPASANPIACDVLLGKQVSLRQPAECQDVWHLASCPRTMHA